MTFHPLISFIATDVAGRVARTSVHLLTGTDSITDTAITTVQDLLSAVTSGNPSDREMVECVQDASTPAATDTGLSIRDKMLLQVGCDNGARMEVVVPQPKLSCFSDDEAVKQSDANVAALILAIGIGGSAPVRSRNGGTPVAVISGKRSRRKRKH